MDCVTMGAEFLLSWNHQASHNWFLLLVLRAKVANYVSHKRSFDFDCQTVSIAIFVAYIHNVMKCQLKHINQCCYPHDCILV